MRPVVKHMKYSNAQKLEIVSEAKRIGISAAARCHRVDRKMVRDWLATEERLRLADPNGFRLEGGGRKLISQECEELVLAKIFSYERINAVSRAV